jgi:uncharacterized protein involved in exopolysaccharide biosynthesis
LIGAVRAQKQGAEMQSNEQRDQIVGYFIPASPVPMEGLYDWSALTRRVLKRKWVVAVTTLLFAVAFGVVAAYSQRIYRAEALVTLVEQDGTSVSASMTGQLGRLASLAGVNLGAGSGNKQELLAFLTSRSLLSTYIEREQLMPVLFPDRWDSDKSKWRDDLSAKPPTMDEAVETLRRFVIDVTQDRLSGLVVISADHRNPAMAAQLVNRFIAVGNAEVRARVANEATRSLEFLDHELAATQNVDVRRAIFELMQQQLSSRMLTSVREDYAYKIVDPAFVPDDKRFERPRRVVYVAIGAFLGLLLGCLYAIVRD